MAVQYWLVSVHRLLYTSMCLTLRAYGAKPHLFLPSRMDAGYGLSLDGFTRLIEEFGKPDLLLALDCGTTSIKELTWLRDQGIDCVIIDHHELAPDEVASR